MTFRLLILLTFFSSTTLGQIESKKCVDQYVRHIDRKFKRNKLTSKTYPDRSIYGGVLTGYYLDSSLVLIKSDLAVGFADNEYAFYLKNDSLIFARENISVIKEPDNFEEYINKNTDKNGNTNFSKLPLATDDKNIYYISDNKIFDCRLKSFNKKRDNMEDYIANKNNTILQFFNSFLSELRQIP